MEKRGEKLEQAKDKLAKQKPPKKPARCGGPAAGGTVHGLHMGKFLKWSRRTSAPRGPTAPSRGESACGMASGFAKKSGSTRQRPSSGPSPYVKATADYHFRMAAQEHPEMSGNSVSQMWRKHRLKKQYQKRARGRRQRRERQAPPKTAAATEKAGAKIAGFVKRIPVGVAGPGLCAPALYDCSPARPLW